MAKELLEWKSIVTPMPMTQFFLKYGVFIKALIFLGVTIYFVVTDIPLAGKALYILLCGSTVLLLTELWQPFSKNTYEPKRATKDILFSLMNKMLVSGGWNAVFLPFAMKLTGAKAFTDMAFMQNYMPLWLEVIAACFVVEFMRYWVHRLQHSIPLLWRFHSLHHSQGNPYILNVYTNHPIDELLRGTIPYSLLFVFGFSIDAFMLTLAFLTIPGLQTHSNANYKNASWINKLFPTNELHRWHHSTDIKEGDKNFGTGIILYDRLFGTYYLPEDRIEPKKYGVEPEGQPKWGLFKWSYIQPVESSFYKKP